MRANLVSVLVPSIGVTCTAALVLPLVLTQGTAGAAGPPPGLVPPAVPGSTQSLALGPSGDSRALAPATVDLTPRGVRPFSLVGVVWKDPDRALTGTVQVRTRSLAGHRWSDWHDLETHNAEHGADPGTAERAAPSVRGATAPLWVGASDGVRVRVRRTTRDAAPLPDGLRVDLVDPGPGEAPVDDPKPGADALPAEPAAGPHGAPRPEIVTRKGWGADEKLREPGFHYTNTVKAVFVHHSDTGNGYACADAPAILRGIYRYHVKSNGWSDLGYNFAVDKCGNVYEGRAGGVAKPVLGAHTLGFNTDSAGIAVLGTYDDTDPPPAVEKAVAGLVAWKLGLYDRDPRGRVRLVSAGSGKYRKGAQVTLDALSGHRDGYVTDCPGDRLYRKLGSLREAAAKDQGR